jgi:hypothetical protein
MLTDRSATAIDSDEITEATQRRLCLRDTRRGRLCFCFTSATVFGFYGFGKRHFERRCSNPPVPVVQEIKASFRFD